MDKQPVKVLFVCLGNICRSPTAHALFQTCVNKYNLEEKIIVDSAGTGDWHVGLPPDKRAQAMALKNGYDMSHLRARQVSPSDFIQFDYILGMDHDNLHDLKQLKPSNYQGVLGLFLSESGIESAEEVPDPYYGNEQHFENSIKLIQDAVEGLFLRIKKDHNL